MHSNQGMPELPDLTVYLEAIGKRALGSRLTGLRVASPFLLRSIEPGVAAFAGRPLADLRRIGKRLAFGFEGGYWAVLHLMIAGRLHWKASPVKLGARNQLAAFDFESGCLWLSEAGTQRRASLHLVQGEQALQALDPGGLEVMTCTEAEFSQRLTAENHTLKRSLTDPHVFAGIGNAYSDEILLSARLSPVALTQNLAAEERTRLFQAIRGVLGLWVERLRVEAGRDFPEKVTAFRAEMGAHGRYGLPCPQCAVSGVSTRIERIRYASNETNYCPRCQTGGRVLADRSLSRLLHRDWPKTVEEWEALRRPAD